MASATVENVVNYQQEIVRPLANFSPSLWGDLFTSVPIDNQVVEFYAQEIESLKEKVRRMIVSNNNNMAEKLNLIDSIERLGVSYHFEREIEEQILNSYNACSRFESDDLHTVALYFRLLRQHGHHISSGIFRKFMESDGKFKNSLRGDAKGLLSLYEAANLRTRGEGILDEALTFATAHLESIAPHLSSPLKEQVAHALEQCLQRGIPRVEARRYISVYEEYESKNDSLLRLAKMDFNLLQMLHRKELCELSRWWKELDLVSKLSYARDRVVECYFWTLGVYFEPQYSRARIMLAKTIAMISVIDDTYDSYGTVDELEIFTDAVERWDIKETDRLPDYMKICYRVLLDLYDQYEQELRQQGRSFAVHYAKATVPYYLLAATSFIGINSVTREAFDWLMGKPKIQVANVTICRIVDDVATYEIEKKRGQSATGIECYMKDYGVSEEEAMEEFKNIAENAWKDINEECVKEKSVSMEVLKRVVNLSRLIDVVYKHNQDGYTHPEKVLKPLITGLLVDSFNV
ncbi:UNVERIFIED_CONTAM: Viridiflorene synthase [Sesamum calycinum]|uniref:Viridiflorene synthase n=1 Tax=Sesamum calycinum TaxID=2727403 RepID=A0AAW2LZK1_9LAMI